MRLPKLSVVVLPLLLMTLPMVASVHAEETVPSTVQGGSNRVKRGGQRIGEGFRHLGRGIRDVFTGESSKGEFKQTRKIGEGVKDIGTGTAGVGRGVGRGVRDGVKAPAQPGD